MRTMRALTATRNPSRRLLSASSVSTLALAAMLVSAPGGQLLAQVAPNSAATQVRNADNGVPVVQIANPNAAGISVNTYDAFNVSSRGVVLNNATAADANAEGRVTTQLAGLVDINRNLTAPARAILNEVTSTNPTVLAGYLEVAGQKADVIVANPNGISCGGCGVINTAAFTLTTGRSRIDGTGQLLGFDVTGGTIALTGAGLDAQTTDYAALLGRKIALGGPAYGKVLDVVGGAHRWDYQARTASALAGVGAAPDYAIDSTAVGGIYANRIRLIATEAGVGVRLLGDAAAVADDLTITAAGDLELRASISAARDLAIAAGSAGAGDLTASDTSLTAGRDLALAAAGKTTLTGGAIVASGNLSLTSAALADTASATALANANQRYAGGTMSFDIAGAATLGGTSYGAAGSLTGLVGSLATTGSGFVYSNGGALTLTAGTGNLDLGSYAVTSPGALTLDAAGFVSSAGNGTVVSDNGAVTVRAGAGLNNAGTIAANAGGIALQLGGTSANSGTIVAQGDLTLADRSGGGSEAFTNAAGGRLLTAGSLSIKAAGLRNDGTVQAARTIATADTLANTGLFIAATDPAADAAITVGSLTNAGTLQASRDLALHLATSFANNGTASAARGLTIDGGAVATNAAGAAISGATVNAVLASLDNAGTVVGGSALTLSAAGTLTNRATIGTNGGLVVTAGSLSNAATGTLQSGMGGSVSAAGALVNAGAIYLANASGSGTISAGTLDNQAGGQIVSQADLALRIGGATLVNEGNLLAQGSLAITGTGTALAVTNAGGAFIQAGSAAGKSVTIGGTAVNLTTAANSVLTGNGIALTLASLDNAGALNANGALAFTATGAASNSGVLIAGTTLTGTAASVANSASGGIQGGTGVTLSASGTLANAGTILTTKGNGGAITLGGALDNAAGAIVQADGLLSLTLAGAGARNAGTLLGVGGVALHGGANAVTLTNAATGVVAAQAATGAPPVALTSDGGLSLVNIAGGVLTADRLALGLASLDNAGAIGATAGSNTINVAGTLANSGNLVLSADTASSGTVTAASLTNSGSLASNGALTVNLSTVLANSGALQAVGNLSLIAGSNPATLTNSAIGRIASGSALSISGANTAFSDQSGQVTGQTVAVTLASLANTGSVVANGNLGLTVSGALANSGTIGANATLTLAAGNLDNASAGQIQSETGGAITVAGLLDDAGRIFLANSSGNAALTLGSLKVQQGARLVSLGKLALTFAGSAPALDNAGLISAQDDITLSGTGLALTNRLTGTIQTAPASPTATGRITLDGSGTALINQGLVLGNGLDWSFASLDNPGTIQSRGDLALTYSGAGQNAGTIYAQGGTAAITAAGFTNLAGSVFQADKGATFTLAGDLNNAGTLIGSTDGAGTLLVNAANLANSSAIQSGKDATFNLSGSGFVNSGTVIAAGDLAIHGTGTALAVSATGSGVIAAQAAAGAPSARLTIDGPSTVLTTDAGAAIAADAASLTLGSFVNAGRFVTGSGATDLTIAGTLTNTGKVFTGGTLGLTVASLDNRLGAVFAPDNGTITLGTSLINAGTIYVPGNLALRAINGNNRAIALDNRFTAGAGGSTGTDGLFQVVGTLDAKAGGLALGIDAGSTLLAGRLDLGVASISNAGTIQGDVGSSIGLSGALLNQGAIYFVPAASGIFPAVTISADTITNGGTGDIEAATGLALNGTNGISNAQGGKIVANDALTLATPGSGAQVVNAGLLSADTILANQVRQFVFQPTGRSTSRQFTMRPNDSGLTGTLLQLADGAQISASDSFLIGVDSLSMQGAGSRLVGGSGVSGLTTFGPLTVNGLIYGDGGLNLEVRSDQPLVVSSTGAIASGGVTTIVARPAFVSQVGQVINSGEIYGATAVNITAGGAIINKGSSDVASASAGFAGSIDSGGTITLTTSIPTYGFVGTIANYSQINATGDITINTTNFINSTPGDWTRTSSSQTTSDPSTLVSVGARSCTNATPSVCTDEQIFRRQMHRFDVESFANGLTGPSYAPQVVSGGSLSVNGFNRVENVGGTLSAGTINLNGANASSTFLQDSLGLETKETRFYFLDVVRHTITFANPSSSTVLSDVTTTATKTCFSIADDPACGQNFGEINTLFSIRAAATNPGIFAGALNGNNFGLTNVSSVRTVNANTMTATATAPGASSGTATGTAAPTVGGVGTTGATGATAATGTGAGNGAALAAGTAAMIAGVSGAMTGASAVNGTGATAIANPVSVTTVGGKPAVSFGGTTVTLPTNPNGRFVTVPGSSGQFLVESNPLFTMPLASLSSDLLAQKLGIGPDALGKRLGDADYEAYLISQQLLGATGRTLLSSYASLDDQLSALYDNAAKYAQANGLTIGQPLTEAQAAALPGDIIWLVRTTVGGESVLAPVVYLSPATKAALVTGSGIIADNVNLQLTSLTNDGGNITGTKTNVIRATGNIINTNGAQITGGQVYLKSATGTVSNLASTIQGTQSVAIVAAGDVTNTGGTISADRIALRSDNTAVDLKGGTIAAGTALSVDQYQGIKVDGTNNLYGKNLALTTRGGSIEVATQTQTVQNGTTVATQVGPRAAIVASESLTLNAAKDINVNGGTVSAGKDLVLNAGNAIDIGTVTTIEASASKTKQGRTTTTSASTSTTNIGSNLSAGGNLVLKSGGSTTITGSNVNAAGDAAIVAGGAVTIAAATDTSSSKTTEKYSGVFQKRTTTTTVDTATNVGSNVTTGGSLYVKSGGDTNITGGSQIKAGGDVVVDTSGNNLNILAGNDKTTTVVDSKKSGFGVGGGLYGSESVHTTDKETRNVSSGIAAGGQLALVNNKNVTIQGSNVSADKGGLIQATNDVNILAGADTSEVTSHKETSCILCVSSSSSGSTSAGASAFAKKTGSGGEVSAQAQASAEGKNSSSLNFYSKTVTDSQAKKSDSVASNVTFGDKGAIVAGNTLTIQGSNVATTVGDLVLKGKDVNILSGENTETSTTTSKTTSVGIFVDSQGKASAEAKAGAIGAVAGKGGNAALAAGGNASAKASAEGSSTVTIGARVTSSKDTTDKLTNVGSQISSGGNLVIVADNDITTRGANLSAAGKLVESATNINNLAATDHDITTSSSSQTTAGLYLTAGGKAEAEAGVEGSVQLSPDKIAAQAGGAGSPAKFGATAGVKVQVDASAGVRVANEASNSVEGSTHAVTTTLSAGTDVVRVAKNAINDQGTQIAAGGDILQSATTLTDRAAADTKFSSTSSRSDVFEIGVTANAGVSQGLTTDAQLGAGVKQGFTHNQSAESESSSKAVTSSYNAGGRVVSVTSGKTSLEGTQIKGDQGVAIQAGSFDYQAAQNTENKSGKEVGVDQKLSVDIIGKTVAGGVEAEYGKSSSASSEAVVGRIESGSGKVSVTTTGGDLRLVGTEISGAKGVDVGATGGKVLLEAARSTSTSTAETANAGVDFTVGKEKKASNGGTPGDVNGNSLEVKGGYQVDRTNTVKNEVVKLSSSQGTVNVVGDSVTLQGTRIDAATGANVVATKGTVTNQAVVDINQSQGGGFNVAIGLEQTPKDAKPGTGGKDPAASANAPSNANAGGVTGNRARANANAAQNPVLPTPSGGRARADANAAQNPVIPSPNPGLGQTDGGTPPAKPKLETEGSGSGGFNVYNQTDKKTVDTHITTQSGPAFVGSGISPIAQQAITGPAAQQVAIDPGVAAGVVTTRNQADSLSPEAPQTGGASAVAAGGTALRQGAAVPGAQTAGGRATGISGGPSSAITVAPITANSGVRAQAVSPAAGLSNAAAPAAVAPVGAAIQAATPLASPEARDVSRAGDLPAVSQAVVPVPTNPIKSAAPVATVAMPKITYTPAVQPGSNQTGVTTTVTQPPREQQGGGTPTTPEPQRDKQGGGTSITAEPQRDKQGGGTTITPEPQRDKQGGGTTTTPEPQRDRQGGGATITPEPQRDRQGGGTSITAGPQRDRQGGGTTITPEPQRGRQGGGTTITPEPQRDRQGGGITITAEPQRDKQGDRTGTNDTERSKGMSNDTTSSRPVNQLAEPASMSGHDTNVRPTHEDSVPAQMDRNREVLRPQIAPAPKGQMITGMAENGGDLPCWITIDPRTGAIKGKPSDGTAAANVPVIVVELVPQADGTTRRVSIEVKPNQFGAGGTECNTVRTIPTATSGQAKRMQGQ
ncbi:MAG: hypothetical protein ABT20_03700 [Rubrivivax sp. SCN 70-15]|nr:MAG: hypothetical protein ABT20_03700 [Rubrivivax sp. SCN 70-15]